MNGFKNGFRRDLTKGPIAQTLLALAFPIFLGNVLQTAYNITDTFWVGRLGAESLAAVSISFPIIFLLISLAGGMAMAGTILVSQYRGKGDKRMVDHVSEQTLIMLLFFSLIFTVIGYFASEPLLWLIGAEEAVAADAVAYLQMSFLGFVFVLGFFGIQALLRGVGEVKIPIYIVLVTVLLNFLLDPLFIFGWGPIPAFGVAGAALATIGTQSLATLIGLFVLFGGRYDIHIRRECLKPDIGMMGRIFRLGFPTSLEHVSRSLGMTAITILAVSFGTIAVAAFGIGIRIFTFILIPAFSLAMATTTMVGQSMGAGKIKRAERTSKIAATMGFFLLLIAGAVVFLDAEIIAAAFIPDNPAVIKASAEMLRIMSLGFGFLGIQLALIGTVRGAGKTNVSLYISFVYQWLLEFPLAAVLSIYVFGSVTGIWMAYPIAGAIGAAILITYFLRGTWKKGDVTGGLGFNAGLSRRVKDSKGIAK